MSTYTQKHHIYYKNNRDVILKKSREWYYTHPVEVKVKNKHDYWSNRLERLKQNKRWRTINQERINYYVESIFIRALDIICDSEQHMCNRCGERDLRCLQFDHIIPIGCNNRKTEPRNKILYFWILKHEDEARQKFQILCANCNIRKVWEDREYIKSKKILK